MIVYVQTDRVTVVAAGWCLTRGLWKSYEGALKMNLA